MNIASRAQICLGLTAVLFCSIPLRARGDDLWKNSTASADARAHDLLPRLTLAEKISLLHADSTFTTPGVPRLGIAKLWMSDGPQGVREEIESSGWDSAHHTDDFSTAMPADIGLAATFDPELGLAYGNVIGAEAKTRGKNIMLCPAMNIMRTPLNGRNSEYMGEDPFLAAQMVVGFINGVQSHGVAACAKHFALNNQETQRGSINVHVDERTMHEIYLPAFKAAVTKAHALTIMTAYNRVNGQYCSENQYLLNQVLKSDWGFTGLVMTDWGGCHSTIAAANNGLDLEMGSNVGKDRDHANDFLNTALLDAVNAGTVPMSRIDDMVLRNLRVMAATGLFDKPVPAKPDDALMAPDHIEACRKIAESACVLLKNEHGVLPLDVTKIKTIAVIGANATAKFAHQGNSAQIKTRYEVTPLLGITNRAGEKVKILFAEGYRFSKPGEGKRGLGGASVSSNKSDDVASDPMLTSEAVDAAKAADVAIVVAGLYRDQDQEGRDRPDMNLPAGQAELIAAVTKANPNTVVVLTGGSPSVVEPWIGDAAGLIMYWYGGTEGGNALANVLFGDVNPSGHLPCTWPKKLSDSPAHADANSYPGEQISWHGDESKLTPDTGPQQTYSEGLLVGYRWFDQRNIQPQFPFGFGLSYTTFDIADLKISTDSTGFPTVHAMVKNTGNRAGAQVVQCYVGEDSPTVPRPLKELKGFAKISLNAGQSGEVAISLDRSAFSHFSPADKCWIADAGTYTIYLGDSSQHLPVKSSAAIEKEVRFTDGQ